MTLKLETCLERELFATVSIQFKSATDMALPPWVNISGRLKEKAAYGGALQWRKILFW